MLACAGGRNRPLALSICYSPNILTLYCRWKGRAPIGPLGEHIATTANADRASSICLEACIGANAITFLVFDKADVQVRACMCGFVRASARALPAVPACVHFEACVHGVCAHALACIVTCGHTPSSALIFWLDADAT